jgi:hypothetical protein
MNAKEFEEQLSDLEARLDRLKGLYEQYFQGFERLEPMIPRKEVDRRLAALRREQPRNTALRFRFQSVLQRYTTYQNYWRRVTRQIEEGTFRRDVLKARARRDAARKARRDGASGRDAQGAFELDVDVDVDLEVGADVGVDAGVGVEDAATTTFGRPPDPPSVGAQRQPVPPGLVRSAPTSASLSYPSTSRASAEPSTAAPLRTFGNPLAPGPVAPGPVAPDSVAPDSVANKGAAGPRVAAAPSLPPSPLTAVPPPSRPQQAPTLSPFALPKVPPRPVASTASAPGAAPARVGPPPLGGAPRPAPTRAASPAPHRGEDDAGLRRVYERYVEARRQNNERTDNLRYETVVSSIKKMLPKLQEKHRGRHIDFEVVMKDGKVGLKPVPKDNGSQ